MNLKTTEREWSDDELTMIETMGGTGFTPEEIAEVLLMDEELFLQYFADKDGVVYKRYRKGMLLAALTLRQRIFKDAGHGSSPAQTLAKNILDAAIYHNKKHEG